MAKVRIECPQCGKRYRLEDSYLGRRVRCKKCGTEFVISRAKEKSGPGGRRVKVVTPQGEAFNNIRYYRNTIAMEFVLVPAGEFMMGSHDGDWPQLRVKITKPFLIGAYEVTLGQYEEVMGKNPSEFQFLENPVGSTSWKDAVKFCRHLSEQEGATYRLPTDAEWEYACRAGTTTRFYTGETISTDQANYKPGRWKGVYRKKKLPVGSFPPNAFGLYDMHGNVWEWCEDWYEDHYYRTSPMNDPKGPATGEDHVLRGGSWNLGPWFARSANRTGLTPVNEESHCGFRARLLSLA